MNTLLDFTKPSKKVLENLTSSELTVALFSRFWRGLAVSSVGTTMTLYDVLKSGSFILGIIGAILSVLGGWYAYQSQKTLHRIRLLELEKILKQT